MRIVRSVGVTFAAAVLAVSLGACELIGSDKPSVRIENMPEGTWAAAGDLCKIITAEKVAAMFNQGPLTSKFDQAYFESGKFQGIDFCSYVAASGETVISLNARKITDQEWATLSPPARGPERDSADIYRVHSCRYRRGILRILRSICS